MLKTRLPRRCFIGILTGVMSVWAWFPTIVRAQLPGSMGGLPGAGESADSENSRVPFKLILEGVLNPTLESEHNLATLQMTVRGFREYYQFAVRRAEVPEFPQTSPKEVLASLEKYKVQLKALGDKELLSRIGQALPGTPMRVVGFFTRRYRELQVVDVEVFGTDGLFNSSRKQEPQQQPERGKQ